MKPIIVYTSKYGSTEKYANWLSEALQCPAKNLKSAKAKEFSAYDTVIYGGGIYAGRIAGFKKFISMLDRARDIELVLFMVGLTNPADEKFYTEMAERNIPAEWKERFHVFPRRGDQLFSKMSGLHRLMMRMPKLMTEKVPEAKRTEDMNEFLANFGKDVIHTSKEQLEPLIQYLHDY